MDCPLDCLWIAKAVEQMAENNIFQFLSIDFGTWAARTLGGAVGDAVAVLPPLSIGLGTHRVAAIGTEHEATEQVTMVSMAAVKRPVDIGSTVHGPNSPFVQ